MVREYFIIILICCALIACNEEGTTPPTEKTASQLIQEGWTAYINKNYQIAIKRFVEAIQKDGTISDAYNGTGWTLSRMDSLAQSVTAFQNALTINGNNYEAQSGLAFDLNALKQYNQSNYYALEVLNQNGNWTFSHDTTINKKDLHIVIAQNYFAQAKFDSSLSRVQIIEGSFNADISTLNGQKQLAAKIEELFEE
ncbi:MAG: hypothetical protein HY960_03680 [Ignavibacteriae bacterium]|nr:hypothetical protein [Ignavibacteriota bacterium]